MDNKRNKNNSFFVSMISGSAAGTCVDTALFPLDTVKTRLQSQHGFLKSGGFKGLYKGIGPVILGSAPTAALFFTTYDTVKSVLCPVVAEKYHPLIYMGGASFSEVVACVVRVPVEVIKQRKQALLSEKIEFRLLYRGFWSTALRDMPFSLIQFPMWEYFKKSLSKFLNRDLVPFEGAICGAIAGGFSAAATTPLDVVKTRIMLASKKCQSSNLKILNVLGIVYRENGIRGLFAGFTPRVTWITIGGFVFFGVYEKVKSIMTTVIPAIPEVPL